MIIIVAILALVVVNALGESPWGVFSVAMTIPIALFMGVYLRFWRPGKVSEVSVIGFVLLMAAIIGGGAVADSEWGAALFTLDRTTIAWAIIVYGFVAAVLPVWLLLAPRDYLSTFMKIGTILMLAVAIVVVQPAISAPAVSEFAGRAAGGPVVSGPLFPFLFVTIACGALSGFHALIASGTTPKLVEKERQTRLIGYGGMLMESFVAIMALVAALSIDRGIYFAMNASAAATGGAVESAAAFVNQLGLTGVNISPDVLAQTARTSASSRSSRAPAAPRPWPSGSAHIMQQLIGGTGLMSFWYHFAIMFEALFILTAVDAGTRVARFMLQDFVGNFAPRFRDTSWRAGAWICTAVMVAGWGAILIMGVTDPLGGINSLFPLFGIANQLLAAIALAVCLAIVARRGRVGLLWVPAVPLAFATAVTVTASLYKIFSSVPAIGYWAQNAAFRNALAEGKTSFGTAKTVEAMQAVVRNTLHPGHALDHLRHAHGDRDRRCADRDDQVAGRGRPRQRGGAAGAVADLRAVRVLPGARGAGAGEGVGAGGAAAGAGASLMGGADGPAPMGPALMERLRALLWWVRGVLGEHAYDQYLAHHHRSGHAGPPMTEREFWRARTDHQERNPQGRCC